MWARSSDKLSKSSRTVKRPYVCLKMAHLPPYFFLTRENGEPFARKRMEMGYLCFSPHCCSALPGAVSSYLRRTYVRLISIYLLRGTSG